MDDMDLLRDLGRELEHEPPAGLARQRNRLTSAGERRTISSSKRRPLLAITVITAAVVAVPTALLSGTGVDHAKPRPQTPRTTPGPPKNDSARITGPETWPDRAPRPDQYVFVESKQVGDDCEGVADAGGRQKTVCKPGVPEIRRIWRSADDSRPTAISVSSWGRVIKSPGCVDGRRVYKDHTERCRPEPADLSGLPASEAGMSSYLDQRSQGGRPAAELRFKAGVDAFQEAFIPADKRKTLFNAIARGPAVTRNAHATDWIGRKAVSLSFTSTVDATRVEVFFDPKTYQRIGLTHTMTESRDGWKKGSVLSASAVLRIAFTDKAEMLP
jgi:hypothetical protein